MAESNNSESTSNPTEESSESKSADEKPKKESPKAEFSCVCCVCEPKEHFETQQELQRHVRDLHPDADIVFACWHCNREFSKFYRLIRHVGQGHRDCVSPARRISTEEPEVAGAATDRSPSDPTPAPAPQKINKENGEPIEPWEEEHVVYAVARKR